jgi:hypothetical protein
LLTASFRFHLAMDTLAVQLTLPTTKRVRDFHPIAINHASHTSSVANGNVKYSLTYDAATSSWY